MRISITSAILSILLILSLIYVCICRSSTVEYMEVDTRIVPIFLGATSITTSTGLRRYITDIPRIRLYSRRRSYSSFPAVPPNTFFCYDLSVISDVKNQGYSCGSCWAFVIADMITDRIRLSEGGSFTIQLSPQQLINCSKGGCTGTSPESVLDWISRKRHRLSTDETFPYLQEYTSRVLTKCTDVNVGVTLRNAPYSIVQFAEELVYDESIIEKNVQNMKRELISTGPFYAVITVYSDFFDFTETRPYSNTVETIDGGHVIEIVGFCDRNLDLRPGYIDGYWICKNSWGKSFPGGTPIRPGFFTMSMGINMCGIESRCGSCLIDSNKPISIASSFVNLEKFQINLLSNK